MLGSPEPQTTPTPMPRRLGADAPSAHSRAHLRQQLSAKYVFSASGQRPPDVARLQRESGTDKPNEAQRRDHLFSLSGLGLPEVARLLRESGADKDMMDQDARRPCSSRRSRGTWRWRASSARAGRMGPWQTRTARRPCASRRSRGTRRRRASSARAGRRRAWRRSDEKASESAPQSSRKLCKIWTTVGPTRTCNSHAMLCYAYNRLNLHFVIPEARQERGLRSL